MYRVTHLLVNLGWVDFDFGPGNGKLAELGSVVKKVMFETYLRLLTGNVPTC